MPKLVGCSKVPQVAIHSCSIIRAFESVAAAYADRTILSVTVEITTADVAFVAENVSNYIICELPIILYKTFRLTLLYFKAVVEAFPRLRVVVVTISTAFCFVCSVSALRLFVVHRCT